MIILYNEKVKETYKVLFDWTLTWVEENTLGGKKGVHGKGIRVPNECHAKKPYINGISWTLNVF